MTQLKILWESREKNTSWSIKICQNKKDWKIKTNIEKKNYGFVYDKRALFEDLTTLPFGF